MKTNEAYAKGFTKGWDKCRTWICKQYNLDEADVIENEKRDW